TWTAAFTPKTRSFSTRAPGSRDRGPILTISGPIIINFLLAAATICGRDTPHRDSTMDFQPLLLFVIGSVLPSFIVALLATYIVRANAARWGLIDLPSERKVHTSPTPRGGGLAIWLSVVATFVAAQAFLWFVTRSSGGQSIVPEFARPHLPGIWAQS